MKFFVRDGKRSAKKAFLIVMSIMALVAQPLYGVIASQVAKAAAGDPVCVQSNSECYTSFQDAVNAAATTGDVISLQANVTVPQQVTINKTLTINGNGHTVSGSFVKNGTISNSIISPQGAANTVTINNLTVDAAGSTNLHGINVYKATTILNGVTIRNTSGGGSSTYGLIVNNANVTANGVFTTSGNDNGVNVDAAPATFTMNGQHVHTGGYAIVRQAGSVADTNNQYNQTWLIYYLYSLKAAPAAPVIVTPTEGQVITTTTTNNTVNITWNAVPGAHSYIVTVDGVSTSVTGTSHVLTSPTGGAHTVKVQSVAQSGLLGGTSAVRNFTIDVDQLPQATIVTPAVNGYVRTKPSNKLHITGTFTDDRTANYLQLQLVGHNSGNPVGSFGFGSIWTTGGPFTYDLTVPANIEDGTYQLTYTPTDYDPVTGGGQFGTVGSVAFTIDNTAPQFSNISITPRINSNTGGSSVTVYFDITDAAGVDLDKTYVMFADGPNTANQLKESVKVKPVLISGNSYKATFDSFQFVKANYVGNYNLQFTSEDVLGNRSSSKPSAFRNILVDNSGPSSTWTAPNNGDVISGTTRFSFDVSDHTGVLSGYVKLNGPTTKSYNLVHDTGSIWYADVPTTELIGGSYTVDARFVDVFNRPRYGANKGMVIIDNTAPTISSIIYNASPSGTQVFTNGYTNEKDFVFHLTSDADTTRYQLKYWNDISGSSFKVGSPWSPTNLSSTGHMATLGEYTDNFTQGEGVHYFSFSACDAAGNCSAYGDPFVVTYDNTAPAVTVNSIDDIQLPTNTQTITGTVADANTVTGVEVSTDGGATWQPATFDGTNWTYDATGLSVETYTVVARATDEAGNTSSDDTSSPADYWTTFTVTAVTPPNSNTNGNTGAGSNGVSQTSTNQFAAPGSTNASVLNANNNGNATTDTTPTTDEATDTDVLAATTTDSNKDSDAGQVLAAEDTKGNWSVVNLVLAVVTIILSLGALLGLARKKDGTAARIMTLIPVAIAVTAFLMIENWTASMIWLNWWTVLYAVVLAVQVAIVSGLKNSAE